MLATGTQVVSGSRFSRELELTRTVVRHDRGCCPEHSVFKGYTTLVAARRIKAEPDWGPLGLHPVPLATPRCP